MRERSFLQSVFALDLRHPFIAGFIALAVASGVLFAARHLPLKYTASALLSIDPPPSAKIASGSKSPALATADEILRSDQFAALGSRLRLFSAQARGATHFRSQITLTQPNPATLRVTLTGIDPRATTTAANAIASLLAAWVPIDAPSSPPPSAAPPLPATSPVPSKIEQPATTPTPAAPVTNSVSYLNQTGDLDQRRHELAGRQAALELQFDRTNRRLITLSAKLQKVEQNSPASVAAVASIEKQQTSLRALRARQLRQLEANDDAGDTLRARAAAARRNAATTSPPTTVIHAAPVPTRPPPSAPVPAAPPPEPTATRISFSVAAWAHSALPLAPRQKLLLIALGIPAACLCGLIYLILAVRFYRPVSDVADLKQILPEQAIFLGAIPAPSATPSRSTP